MSIKLPFKSNFCAICQHFHWRLQPDFDIGDCCKEGDDRKDQCDCIQDQFRPTNNLEYLEWLCEHKQQH